MNDHRRGEKAGKTEKEKVEKEKAEKEKAEREKAEKEKAEKEKAEKERAEKEKAEKEKAEKEKAEKEKAEKEKAEKENAEKNPASLSPSELKVLASKITVPVDFDGHILRAELKSNGKVVGGHSTATGDVRVKSVEVPPNAQGVYVAKIEMEDPLNPGSYLPKSGNGKSTMFPDSWTSDRIKVEVDMAFKNKQVSGRYLDWNNA